MYFLNLDILLQFKCNIILTIGIIKCKRTYSSEIKAIYTGRNIKLKKISSYTV